MRENRVPGRKIGIIGGSSLYSLDGLKITDKRKVRTPFGDPSDEMVSGVLEGREVLFMPRHMRNHSLLPTEINFRANIFAFKVMGAGSVISVSAVGSLKEEIKPMDIVVVDQFIDRTNQGRSTTFFGDGMVAHISFAEPVCSYLKDLICRVNSGLSSDLHCGGTYVNMEGPAFSTKAESLLYKSWGADVIGMTNMQEARLAREAGMCYATIALVTDYDCWRTSSGESTVSADMVLENLRRGAETAKKMIHNTVTSMPEVFPCGCKDALRNAIVTKKEAIPGGTLKKLKPIIGGFI
ncbi:MAG TPA: S-methyl-5'-thioadenosine phosphorylase [Candidatus Omnitrophota bacterium]|nr:S-methyl-5'-thioadenosine phosphorylase [Candidatus Omnitrophota bacterium]